MISSEVRYLQKSPFMGGDKKSIPWELLIHYDIPVRIKKVMFPSITYLPPNSQRHSGPLYSSIQSTRGGAVVGSEKLSANSSAVLGWAM